MSTSKKNTLSEQINREVIAMYQLSENLREMLKGIVIDKNFEINKDTVLVFKGMGKSINFFLVPNQNAIIINSNKIKS